MRILSNLCTHGPFGSHTHQGRPLIYAPCEECKPHLAGVCRGWKRIVCPSQRILGVEEGVGGLYGGLARTPWSEMGYCSGWEWMREWILIIMLVEMDEKGRWGWVIFGWIVGCYCFSCYMVNKGIKQGTVECSNIINNNIVIWKLLRFVYIISISGLKQIMIHI